MLGRISYAARPTACHSYVRLADDTSQLSRKCSSWKDGKYGYSSNHSKKVDCCDGGRFYGGPMVSDDKKSTKAVLLFGMNNKLMLCDDIYTDPNFSTVGQWEFFVKWSEDFLDGLSVRWLPALIGIWWSWAPHWFQSFLSPWHLSFERSNKIKHSVFSYLLFCVETRELDSNIFQYLYQ